LSARDLIERAQAGGAQIRVDNGDLVLRGQTSALQTIVPEAKARKSELLHELTKIQLPKDLESHIERVAKFHGFTPGELIEAKKIAAGDIESAILCFRALIAEILTENESH